MIENNSLSDAIDKVIAQTKELGSGETSLYNDITILGEWEPYSKDNKYDVVTIYIMEKGIIRFRHQENTTKVWA